MDYFLGFSYAFQYYFGVPVLFVAIPIVTGLLVLVFSKEHRSSTFPSPFPEPKVTYLCLAAEYVFPAQSFSSTTLLPRDVNLRLLTNR